MSYHHKDLTKEMIQLAMNNTRSCHAAARYLNVSYQHYKRWAKLYNSDEKVDPTDPNSPFKTLFDKHLNRYGKGIPKFISGMGVGNFPLIDIIEGRVNIDHFAPDKIKDAMIREGMLREYCDNCGFGERRLIDYKVPLLMYFKDGNKRNYQLGNLKLRCYNCYFLTVGDMFNPKQKLHIQDHKPIYDGAVNWELEEHQQEKLDDLNKLTNKPPEPPTDEIDPQSLISRK